jgi:ATP-dependent helicase/nuclease subunit B
MQSRMIPLLLAGPAGSGKTHRCLAEIAAHLRESAAGAPLILVAPRQATYQLERQILSFPGVEGFTRLRILSFQRLAQFVFEATGTIAPKLLDEDGRVMVMRAILARRRNDLRVYRESAQRDGLAQELSGLWREACEHRIGPAALRAAAQKVKNLRLRAKLEDFADVFGDYAKWLEHHELRDGDELLEIAADAVLKGPLPEIAGLWLDGFAQMTPQERRLVNAILPKCAAATLAFCLPERPVKPRDAFSMWSVVARTYCQVRTELSAVVNATPCEEVLSRRAMDGRFDAAAELAHLEEYWAAPKRFEQSFGAALRVVKCANIEGEAVFVAREILKFVRAGGRFREVAVLVRSLDEAHDVLRRVFHRYQIPCFVDRRESVAHHPVAELTRGALRAIASEYRHHELFGALKSGLARVDENDLDWFENMALARGWSGEDWRGKLFCGPKADDAVRARAEKIRKEALQPIFRLDKKLGATPSGSDLAEALRDFWDGLEVDKQLENWAQEVRETLHSTVWTQMEEWLESIELAFANERMPLKKWLSIVEAGLSSLTVGLIPPSLDQVVIGAVDRSRNPDLKAVFLLGVNEGMFPKPGKERLLLNDAERENLAEAGVQFGMPSLWDLGAEQFYAYIACTRARERLTLSYSESSRDGQPLNPSIFISQLRRLFPTLETEEFSAVDVFEAEATHELNPLVFAAARRSGEMSHVEQALAAWPTLKVSWERARAAAVLDLATLSAPTIERLFGKRLRTSVSKLEQFAMCPFRFFVASGLRAEERLRFELDRREEGSFQHEILAEFHRRVQKRGLKWRDVSPAEGRRLVREIGAELKTEFQDGLAEATAQNRFRAEAKLTALEDFIEGYLQLMRGCDFDPAHVELAFGFDGGLPPWRVDVDSAHCLEFTGRIDRVDVWIDPETKRCYALVFDYKSSARKLHRVLVENAIQQQLPAYLAALQKMGGTAEFPFEVRAGGAFYVNLRAEVKRATSRSAAFDAEEAANDLKQTGAFDAGLLDRLDKEKKGLLFDYSDKGRASVEYKGLPSEDFTEFVRATEERLRELGRRIFDGDVRMDPYKKGGQTACNNCFYGAICRIDPWTHPFRKLGA